MTEAIVGGGGTTDVITAGSSWVFCSVGMMVFNKLAVEAIPEAALLVSFQLAVTVVLMATLAYKSLHIGSFYDVLRWSRVAPFFAGVLLSSMFGLKYAPMSLVIVFRGFAPLFSLAVEAFYPEPLKITAGTIVTLLVLLGGIFLYSIDLEMTSSHMSGILWVLLNNAFIVGERLLQRLMLGREQHPVDISKSSCTLLNNLFAMVPILIWAVCTHEFVHINKSVVSADHMDNFYVAMSALVGTGIAYAGIWLQSLISATSFLVLATSNKFIVIMIEVFIMDEKKLTHLQLLGAAITIVAGVAYGKVREAVERDAALEKEALLGKKVLEEVKNEGA